MSSMRTLLLLNSMIFIDYSVRFVSLIALWLTFIQGAKYGQRRALGFDPLARYRYKSE